MGLETRLNLNAKFFCREVADVTKGNLDLMPRPGIGLDRL